MSFKVKVGKHEFEVKADLDALVAQSKTLSEFEEDCFCEFEGDPEETVSKEEFEENVELFISQVKQSCSEDYMTEIVNSMPKKKNGTFYKGRKHIVEYYNNCTFFTEWHNTWGTYELRFSAVSDLVIELQIVRYNHTPA